MAIEDSTTNSQALLTVEENPYNAETPLPALLNDVTPSELVYIRNHFEAPQIEGSDWSLEVGGSVKSPQAFSHSEITALPSRALRMTLECAGNGRVSMDPAPPGTPWGYGAVSVVEFTGAPLSNLLEQAGFSDDAVEVIFHGADKGEAMTGRTEHYVRSLPLEVALSPDTVLAWEMNGEPLSVDHGFPLRLVVPSWYGMASVKWLEKIAVSADKFSGFFQDEQYVYSEEQGTPEGEPVRAIRVRSLILESKRMEDSAVEISGIAWSGEGTIAKVELSWDGGKEWREAVLSESNSLFDVQHWLFQWKPAGEQELEFISRATDSSGNVQPTIDRWNRGGYGNNGLHRVRVSSSG